MRLCAYAPTVAVGVARLNGTPCRSDTLLALITPWLFALPVIVTVSPACRSLAVIVCWVLMRVVVVRVTVKSLLLVSVTTKELPLIWLTVPLMVWRLCPLPDPGTAPPKPPGLPPFAPGVPFPRGRRPLQDAEPRTNPLERVREVLTLTVRAE